MMSRVDNNNYYLYPLVSGNLKKMRQFFFVLIIFIFQNTYSQSSFDTIGYPLKAVFKVCKHDKDTAFSLYYSYNNLHQLTRYEKCIKGSTIHYFYTYTYNSNGKRDYEQTHCVFSFVGECVYKDLISWKKCIINAYALKYDNSYSYDSLKKEITVDYPLNPAKQKPLYDSVYIDSRLVATKVGEDTISTFKYDDKGKLIYEFFHKKGDKSWKKLKYKKNTVIEYYYSSQSWRPYKIIYLVYNSSNQLINKSEYDKVYSRKWYNLSKPQDYYCINNYGYENGFLVLFEQKNLSFDNGIAECWDNYKEIFTYK